MNANISNNWIKTSVFYEKNHWQKLMTDHLKPYILRHKETGNIGSFSFSFNNEQGEHIRLALECTAPDKEQFADDLHNQLNNYLLLNPSPQPPKNYIGKAFFMDYYNNSIQYNLYTLDSMNNDVNAIRSLISERFLNVFAEEEFEESSMFAFALYMLMTFCNTWELTYNEDVNSQISGMLHSGSQTDEELSVSFKPYYDLFNENKEMITDIYDEVLQSEHEDNTVMNLWPLKECYARLLTKSDKSATFSNKAYLPFDKIIMDQTGMKPDLLTSMYYVIYLCINELSGK